MSRLVRLYRWATIPPEGVEKASRRERVKREAWLYASTLLALTLAIGPPVAVAVAGVPVPPRLVVLVGAVTVPLAVALDVFVLFPWGVRRFDLVVPWQFRAEMESTT